jgi:hypothetical protein
MDKRSISTPFAPAKGPIVVNRVLPRPLPEGVAEWPWNQWPNASGMGGRMGVEYATYLKWLFEGLPAAHSPKDLQAPSCPEILGR